MGQKGLFSVKLRIRDYIKLLDYETHYTWFIWKSQNESEMINTRLAFVIKLICFRKLDQDISSFSVPTPTFQDYFTSSIVNLTTF